MKFGVHLVILHVHEQILLPHLSVSVLRLFRDCTHKWSRSVMLNAGDTSIHLGSKAAAESFSRNRIRVGGKCRSKNVSSLGVKLNSKSCSRYLEFLTCVPNF